ncbi:MAG: putative membrane protein [Gemmatimonadaceae bacterium]|nr:putative membrane protein [Gemmatimonadaceae bacterium]
MGSLQAFLERLSALPPETLFGAMAVLAALENVFPPIPADVLVAFGGFMAARNGASPWSAFLAVWIGNVLGAIAMYVVGRRLGADLVTRRLHLHPGSNAESRIRRWHDRYGIGALFMSRFVPGIRAVMPPIAGSLRIPLPVVATAIASASALFYGLVTWLAFNAGANWEVLVEQVRQLGIWSAFGAGGILAIALAIAWRRRHR